MTQALTIWIIGFVVTLVWAIVDDYNRKGRSLGFDTPMHYFFSHPVMEILIGLGIFLILWWLFLFLQISEVYKKRGVARVE